MPLFCPTLQTVFGALLCMGLFSAFLRPAFGRTGRGGRWNFPVTGALSGHD